MPDLDPLAWMYAAVEHIGTGAASELEASWETYADGVSTTFKVTVRRTVRPTFDVPPPDEP